MTIIEDCLSLEVPKDVQLSPDGSQVIYSTGLHNSHRKGKHAITTIWLADTGKEHSARQLTSGLFNDKSPKWAPDGKSIAFISDRAEASKSSAVYILPLAGGEAYPITPADNEAGVSSLAFSPDGKFLAYLSPDEKTPEKKRKDEEGDDAMVWGQDWPFNRLRVVHIGSKKVNTLTTRDAHATELAWSGDGKAIAIFETKTPDFESCALSGTDISVADLVSKNVTLVCHLPNRASDLVWAGEKLYFIASAIIEFAAAANAVFAIDPKADKPSYEKIAHGDEDCAGALSKVGSKPTSKVLVGLEDQIQYLGGERLFAMRTNIIAWDLAMPKNDSKPTIALVYGDVNSPPEVFTLAGPGSKPVQLSTHGSIFKDHKFGSVTFLSCQSLDKKDQLDGLYITPSDHATADGKPKAPLPTVVGIHGGPYYRRTNGFDTLNYYWTPALLAAGYGVLLPNYRGGASHGERHAKYQRGGMGKEDYSDIICMTQHVIEQGFADKEKLLVAGYSQGGFLSYLSSVRNGMHEFGWKFRAAIPGAGVADWAAMAQTSDIGMWEAELAGDGPWNMHPDNTSDRTGSALYELKRAAEKGGVVPPMLILHGEKDVRVPLEQARGFRRGLEFWKLPFEYVIYPREDHLFKEQRHWRDMLERIVAFCDRHLGL